MAERDLFEEKYKEMVQLPESAPLGVLLLAKEKFT